MRICINGFDAHLPQAEQVPPEQVLQELPVIFPSEVFALKRDMSFFTFLDPQEGHSGTSLPIIRSSNDLPQSEHLYSKIGMNLTS